MKPYLFLLIAAFAGCQQATQEGLPYYNSPDFTPRWLTRSSEIDTLHSLADFRFLDQQNQAVTSDMLRGKIHVANFFFSFCPSLCPRMMDNLKPVQAAVQQHSDVLMLSYSVMPERDSVPVLREYAKKRGIVASKWHLLTGDRANIYEIARKSYFADEKLGAQLGENDFLHTENVLLVDKKLHIRGIYNSTLPLDMQQLIADINTLRQESP